MQKIEIFLLVVLPIVSFSSCIAFRVYINDIITYVIGDKVYKQEKREQTLKERFLYSKYIVVVSKWMYRWYIENLVLCIPLPFWGLEGLLYDWIFAFMIPIVPYLFITHMWFWMKRIGNTNGRMYDYSKFVDKYAIRRKIYPELNEDEDEEECRE